MPVPSDASAFTSVTASPTEAQDPEDLPVELKIPLPPSIGDTDEEMENEAKAQAGGLDPISLPENNEGLHTGDTDLISKNPSADTIGGSPPPETHTPPFVSLEELARLVEQERCQRFRTYSIETDMNRLSLLCGLDRRLISTLSIAYGNLIDQYKTDDQAGFGGLYDACEQLKASCETAGATTHPVGSDLEKDVLLPDDF